MTDSKSITDDVGTLQMLVLALMELRGEDRFMPSFGELCDISDSYRLSVTREGDYFDVLMEDRTHHVQCDKCEGLGEVVAPRPPRRDVYVDVKHADVSPHKVPPLQCIACGGTGEGSYDANKTTRTQCEVCGGSGVAPVVEDDG